MKTRYLFFILGLLFNSYAFGQVYVFMVCGSRGENAVKTNGEWKLLKTMSTIDQFDQIKTAGDNCYLGLIHTSGRSITIRQAGTFSAADLLKKVNTGNTAVATKYADFVYSKLTTVGREQDVNKSRSTNTKTISVFIPSSGECIGSDEIIKWTPVDGANKYRIKVKNILDELIAEYISENSFIKINFSDEKLKNQKFLFLSIELMDDPSIHSEIHAIKRLEGDKAKNLTDTFLQIKKDIGEESSLNYLILASFFENNNLLIDAATFYQYAIDLSPEIPDFETFYKQFLFRNGLMQ